MTDKHKELCQTAINWLYKKNCSVFANEVPTWNGIADAIGVKRSPNYDYEKQDVDFDNTVYYIEAKASRSDLLCFKQKCVYKRTEEVLKCGGKIPSPQKSTHHRTTNVFGDVQNKIHIPTLK